MSAFDYQNTELEQWLEIVFTLNHADHLSVQIACLSCEDQELLPCRVRRIAATSTHPAAGLHAHGRDCLPHMYGPANYVVIDEVANCPQGGEYI